MFCFLGHVKITCEIEMENEIFLPSAVFETANNHTSIVDFCNIGKHAFYFFILVLTIFRGCKPETCSLNFNGASLFPFVKEIYNLSISL